MSVLGFSIRSFRENPNFFGRPQILLHSPRFSTLEEVRHDPLLFDVCCTTRRSTQHRIQQLLVGDQLKKWRESLRSISSTPGTSYPAHLGAEDTGCKTLASTYDVWNCCVWYCGDDFSQVLERTSIREISQLQSQRDR